MKNIKNSLIGQLLLAPPQIHADIFDQSVILVCSHDNAGALGLILNHPIDAITFIELLAHLQINCDQNIKDKKVYFGGPVSMNRGFVLHSRDVLHDTSSIISEGIALTSNSAFFHLISKKTPKHWRVALGYAGWTAGQLEDEVKNGVWIQRPAQENLIFETPDTQQWKASFEEMGVDPYFISHEIGMV